MVLDAALLNTQHYKVKTKGKAEQSCKWSSTLPYTSELLLMKKKAFRLPLTKFANFTYLYDIKYS